MYIPQNSDCKSKIVGYILKNRKGFMNECRFYEQILKMPSFLCCKIITVELKVQCGFECFS